MSGVECKTKYPILLLHGAGFRDLKMPLYWGRIPRALKAHGASVYYGEQDCWASVETNARSLCHAPCRGGGEQLDKARRR